MKKGDWHGTNISARSIYALGAGVIGKTLFSRLSLPEVDEPHGFTPGRWSIWNKVTFRGTRRHKYQSSISLSLGAGLIAITPTGATDEPFS